MKPKTEEEKTWFFLGYFYAQAEDLANGLDISKDKAISILSECLKNAKINKVKNY